MLAQQAERPAGKFFEVFFSEEFREMPVALYKHKRKNDMILNDIDVHMMYSEEGVFLGVLIPTEPVITAPPKEQSKSKSVIPEYLGLFPAYDKLIKILKTA